MASQAPADLSVQSSALPSAQAAPTPTPAEPDQSTAAAKASRLPAGNCHSVITSPPPVHQASQTDSAAQTEGTASATTQTNKKIRVPISEEHPVIIDARECEQAGKVYILRGDVQIQFTDYTFRGDLVTYDSASGDVTAKGHVSLDGGSRDIHISGSEGTYNLHSQTGKFYDVRGSTGARFKGRSVTLTSSSPLSFSGKLVEQTGPDEYVLHHGSVTSCELPHPKWTFTAARIILKVGSSAHVYNTTFRLKGVPVFYLPYASPPVERLGRESGFLIPNFGTSNTKGTVIGDSFYWAINRSMDATVGGEFLSRRGWALQENYRYRPNEASFLNLSYFGVLDRGITTTSVNQAGQTVSQTAKQGGEDVKLNAATTFAHDIRGVASIDYLSSFIFRLAFTENFSQAVDSEVKSAAFLTKNLQGFSFNGFVARYQNFQSSTNNNAITILHAPGIELSSVDRKFFGTPIYWSYDVDGGGLRRSQPGFVTPGVVGRLDVDPAVSLPVFFRGWTLRPEVQLRNTVYTQQQSTVQSVAVTHHDLFNRRTIASSIELRPPVLSKVFDGTVAGRKLKHTIEPRLVYRYTNGVEKFSSIIRFDFRDILSNTNEIEFGLLQRLFARRDRLDCNQETAASNAGAGAKIVATTSPCSPAGADEFISWEVKMKYFADPTFGGAVVNGTRNVLTTTASFTGIAFVTDPRRFSPVVSRLRVRTSSNSDLEWQLDYDSKKGRINSSTLYTGFHFGDFFVGASHAYLQVPGEVVDDPVTGTVLPMCIPHVFNQPACVPPLFDQIRAQLGYGSPTKRGWSAAANIGFDREFNLLQYSAAQTSYNWDCCGLSFEYRRFSLGSVRNENQYRFAFTLANIGSFGNLKRQERLF
ncbi:MAG TPA: LPS assembly protein LptD [Candidatus Polarisedimenticolia bacterium]|nr:LPS assembly protein LptD [Candidatus Polarisedimenticolia bacterium]